ncbi:MAG: LacI family transcriptional regulator [Clostridiaceae bacterium]|nr:LacI family transcriptional regulator [Clostridiaceae bacterium]
MGVTINDVAKAAGVSASTVSRVLSDSPRISKKTKMKVRKVIEELEYYPNFIARSLASNSTNTIGLVLCTEAHYLIHNSFFIQAMTGISTYAQENGYNVMYAFNKNEEEDLNIAIKYVSSKSVDGIILFASRVNDKCISYLKKEGFPFSVIGRPDETDGVLWVDNDNFQATYQVTDYLIRDGHTNIAFIGGPAGFNVSKDRFEGFKRSMYVHGLDINESFIFLDGDFSSEFGYECMKKLLENESQSLPTAVVTCDDMQALGVLNALSEKGIDNIAVTGFNNNLLPGINRGAKFTSVDVNAYKLGYYAAKVLIDNILGKEGTPTHYIVPTSLAENKL